jgi:hypothetical protein
MDVLISNVLADERLIPPLRRYQIMRANKDYREALHRELRRLQGVLAVDFRLQAGLDEGDDDDDNMAMRLDRFCLSSSDDTNLAWQTCVSSLVWFIYGESREGP